MAIITPLSKEELSKLKPGDLVKRNLSGVPIIHRVKEVTDDTIILVPRDSQEEVDRKAIEAAERLGLPREFIPVGQMPTWTFNRHNGLEIDEDLGWDGVTKTGSAITGFIED
jgi:hypothetical protein